MAYGSLTSASREAGEVSTPEPKTSEPKTSTAEWRVEAWKALYSRQMDHQESTRANLYAVSIALWTSLLAMGYVAVTAGAALPEWARWTLSTPPLTLAIMHAWWRRGV